FQMYTFGPLMGQGAFEREALALQTHATPEQLDDLRAFPLAHIKQAHGGDAPTAPSLGELARTDQHIQPCVLVVQRTEQCATKVVTSATDRLRIRRHVVQAGIVADIDQTEWLSVAHAQRQLAFAALDVDQLQALSRRGIEYA